MPPELRRPTLPVVLLAAVLGGGVVGLAGRATDHTTSSLLYWAGTLGGPWLLAAFLIGAFAASPRRGAIAGAATLVVGVITYYAIFGLVEERTSRDYALGVGAAWTAGALPVGAAFGWAGGAWRRTRGPRWAAILTGALLGEALLLYLQGRVLGGVWNQDEALHALRVQAIIGVLGAAVLTTKPLRALGWTGGVALAVVVVEATLRETLRAGGWAGA
ncbi:hypothetical protein DSM112329_00096 [Paraconexibacter sp. AEG42_29]|uniref:Uncharacterized protein n=1 Tax=Paraconexibacter sp. AEG42_29 TaxID=2997339 RepID=A0AAU7ANU9_9ACTN